MPAVHIFTIWFNIWPETNITAKIVFSVYRNYAVTTVRMQ